VSAGDPEERPALSRDIAQLFFGVGSGIAGIVYGTVVVMATLTAAYATQKQPWKLALLVASTALVLWVAHLYAHALSESISEHRRLTGGELAAIARRELGILLAAAAPTAALVLGAVGLVRETAAVWLALGIGLVTLGAEGVRYARLEGYGRTGTVVAVALNLALGGLVVGLKVAVDH
jgi:hypothetical protein